MGAERSSRSRDLRHIQASQKRCGSDERKGVIQSWKVIIVTALAIALLATPAAQAKNESRPQGRLAEPIWTCSSARQALIFYRLRYASWQELMGIKTKLHIRQLSGTHGCAYLNWLAKKWQVKASKARRAFYRWREAQWTLRDYAFGAGNNAWRRAVQEAQKVFPGTEGWLLSCSDAEGGHGRWVGYGGVGYSTSLRDSDTVGGPLQFRWSTFKGMYRHALDYVRARGYKVPVHLRDPSNDATWRSALGQALAGGWARYTGNDNAHWSASWNNGC